MTHGDKAKAKAAKSNQASAAKKVTPKGRESGKGPGKEAGQGGRQSRESGQTAKAVPKAAGAKAPGSEKSGAAKKGSPAPAPPKDSGADARVKARTTADNGGSAGGFSNPVIAGAFKRALKKYPNALRKLTD
jgi:hypothetical protein